MKLGSVSYLIFSLAVPFNALGATWYLTPAADGDQVTFVDVDSVVKNQSLVTIWLTQINSEARAKREGASSSTFKEAIDCRAHTQSAKHGIIYDESGAVLQESQNATVPRAVKPRAVIAFPSGHLLNHRQITGKRKHRPTVSPALPKKHRDPHCASLWFGPLEKADRGSVLPLH